MEKLKWAAVGFLVGEALLLPFRVSPSEAVANLATWAAIF